MKTKCCTIYWLFNADFHDDLRATFAGIKPIYEGFRAIISRIFQSIYPGFIRPIYRLFIARHPPQYLI